MLEIIDSKELTNTSFSYPAIDGIIDKRDFGVNTKCTLYLMQSPISLSFGHFRKS